MNSFSILKKAPASLMIHIALIVILAGAFTTHFFGVSGKISLATSSTPVSSFSVESGPSNGILPFNIRLIDADVVFYPGTTTPMDYESEVEIISSNGSKTIKKISMNNIAVYDNWRLYQTGMGDGTSTLSVTYDPWGIGITYCGYALLMLSMLLFFFQPHSAWRGWLRKISGYAAVIIGIAVLYPSDAMASDSLPVLQRPLARNFGDIYVYWNDRVSPMQTMAKDVTVSLYGSSSYKGYTAEQVLTGWLFHFDAWLRDFEAENPAAGLSDRKRKRLNEKKTLIHWLGTGEAFRIFPYHAATGRMEWLSLSGSRPSKMDIEQWQFMTHAMENIASDISRGKNISADKNIGRLIEGQKKYAGIEYLPSDSKFMAEKIYNEYLYLFPVALIILSTGFISMLFSRKRVGKWPKYFSAATIMITAMSWLYLVFVAVLRGYVGGHIPMSNGFETMLCMAVISLTGALVVPKRIYVLRPALLIVAGAALMVAVMGDSHPGIGALMPVLASPLLSIHVMLVMTSYALFFLMVIIGIRTLATADNTEADNYAAINHLLLLPAVFFLAAGIFIGAVWANQSWGRYWGWDPKETCALLTMLIYAIPLHSRSLKIFGRKKPFSIYIIIAFAGVLFTYFGANYLLPGLHSYA